MSEISTHNSIKAYRNEAIRALLEEIHNLKRSNPSIALEKAQQLLDIATSLKDYSRQIEAKRLCGTCLTYIGKPKKSIATFHEALDLVRQYQPNNNRELAFINNCLGFAYSNSGNNQLAIYHLLRSLSLEDDENVLTVYNNLGLVYFRIGNLPEALVSWEAALLHTQKSNDPYKELNTSYNVALCHFKMGAVTKARQAHLNILKSIQQHEEQGLFFDKLKAHTLNGLGEIYMEENNFQEALTIFNEALDLAKSKSFRMLICEILNDKASLCFKSEKEEVGIACLHEALDYANQNNLKPKIQRTLNQLVDFYKSKNRLQEAFPHLEQLYQISQEQFTESRDHNFKKIIAEREKEIKLLEEKNKEIKEHNGVLEQFTHIISHDLREPVRGITGFANLLHKKHATSLDENAKEYLNFILSETNAINNNLARLLEYTSFKKPQQREIGKIELVKIVNNIKHQYLDLAFELDISCDDVHLNMKATHATNLFRELIDNAIQFRKKEEDCHIEIKHQLENSQSHISIKDYGIGIAPQYHEKVFRIFNQLNKQRSNGTGVGLAICQRIINLYNGKIWIESEENEFTTLHFTLPAFSAA